MRFFLLLPAFFLILAVRAQDEDGGQEAMTTMEEEMANVDYDAAPKENSTPGPVAPIKKCRSNIHASQCKKWKADGFCTDKKVTFRLRKFDCAVECGFCGKAAPDCRDNSDWCRSWKGICNHTDTMFVEYECPKTCGFCEHPN